MPSILYNQSLSENYLRKDPEYASCGQHRVYSRPVGVRKAQGSSHIVTSYPRCWLAWAWLHFSLSSAWNHLVSVEVFLPRTVQKPMLTTKMKAKTAIVSGNFTPG
jgi:hypothetical protein